MKIEIDAKKLGDLTAALQRAGTAIREGAKMRMPEGKPLPPLPAATPSDLEYGTSFRMAIPMRSPIRALAHVRIDETEERKGSGGGHGPGYH